MQSILVIDDEEHMRWILKQSLEGEGFEVITVESGETGLALEAAFDLVILDLRLPGMSGLEVLKRLKERSPGIPVIVFTAHGSIDTAIAAMKQGANEYITKPFEIDQLILAVKKSLEVRDLVLEVKYLRQQLNRETGVECIQGQSVEIEAIRQMVRQIALTDAGILITGESGTGKEVVARAIHNCSDRASKPFIAVNCGAIPENLLESELFGYEKGAFTGASARKTGRFELAHQGTLFLDEIGELPLSMQVKLLRFLQEHCLERVGGTQTIKVDVRILAATNRDLSISIREGSFREDLFYRLNVLGIEIPPLRRRREDIPLLANHFLNSFKGEKRIVGFTMDTMKLLQQYYWPGNVRELENAVQRAVILARGEEILPGDLPTNINGTRPEIQAQRIIVLPPGGISLEKLERDLLLQALEQTSNNQTQAARLLGITRSALIYRMQKHGVNG